MREQLGQSPEEEPVDSPHVNYPLHHVDGDGVHADHREYRGPLFPSLDIHDPIEDGEHGEEMIKVSELEMCEPDEVINAVNSSLRWANYENETMLQRILCYKEKGDTISVENLRRKNEFVNTILERRN